MKKTSLPLAIFLLSGAGIAYEIALMRIFSVAQWHHFAYMVISIALLGFGASGTFLSLIRPKILGREMILLRFSALFFAVSLVGCTILSQKIPFETFELVTQRIQLWNLLALYILLSIPFFLVSTCVALAFFLLPQNVGKIYFWNMAGSGLGAAAAIGLLYLVTPENIPLLLLIPTAAAFILLTLEKPFWMLQGNLFLVFLFILAVRFAPPSIRISQYKGISYAMQFPDAAVVAQTQSPMSVVQVVSSRQIRETPGQIANYPMSRLGPLPDQLGLFFDGGSSSVINRFDGDFKPFAYLDYVTSALPYHLLEKPRTLVIGAGGGTDVLNALSHGASHVTAIEVDPSVFSVLSRPRFREFCGVWLERSDVAPVVAEGRGYLQSHPQTYDLIQIALLDSFTAAAAGVHALSESYLYTVEAVELYLARLSPNGILAVTRWLKSPPRDAIKLFATMAEACEKAGLGDPARHLAQIRSWNTATVMLSRSPWTSSQIESIRTFYRERSLDADYFPGIASEETNRYTVLDRSIYFESAKAILSSDRENFYRDYLFYIRPATDNRPYFFQFFKWKSLPRLIRGMGTEWIPFVEWGYLTLVATIIQGALASALFILLPLVALTRSRESRGAKRWVLLYFAALGLAYLFLEIAFIQKFMLFLAYPIYAVAVVLAAFLIFSGVGSIVADRLRENPTRLVAAAVLASAVIALVYFFTLPPLFASWAGWSDWAKILTSLVWLAPLAFAMGIPFPAGLQIVSDRHPALLPWAWGVNGCASVLGALLAAFTSIHFGFLAVVLVAIVIYIGAALILNKIISF